MTEETTEHTYSYENLYAYLSFVKDQMAATKQKDSSIHRGIIMVLGELARELDMVAGPSDEELTMVFSQLAHEVVNGGPLDFSAMPELQRSVVLGTLLGVMERPGGLYGQRWEWIIWSLHFRNMVAAAQQKRQMEMMMAQAQQQAKEKRKNDLLSLPGGRS